MSLDRIRPTALSAELRAEWRAAIGDSLAESRLQRLAAKLWSDAIDAGDFERARAVAAETDGWFEAEGK
jgi:hypothetical protein